MGRSGGGGGGIATGLLGLAAVGGLNGVAAGGGGYMAQQNPTASGIGGPQPDGSVSGSSATPEQNWNNMMGIVTASDNPMRTNDVYTNPTAPLSNSSVAGSIGGGTGLGAGLLSGGGGPSGDQAPQSNQLMQALANTPKQYQNKDFLDAFYTAQQNNRANTMSSDVHETHTDQQQLFQQQQQIQQGMSQAAQTGGYSGVIDYLRTADPDRAMKFEDAKNTLDQHMMQSSVMSALLPGEKAKALAEGYGVLGKMGGAILQAKPADRQAMYDQMQPIIKTINPNAPSDVASAAPMFMLANAQADPNNNQYLSQKTLALGNTAVDNLSTSIQTRKERGETAQNSPGLATELAQLNAIYDTAIATHNKTVNDTLNQNAAAVTQAGNAVDFNDKALKTKSSFQNQYDKQSKLYSDYMSKIGAPIDTALTAIAQNPADPVAQKALASQVGMANTRGKFNGDSYMQWANTDNKTAEVVKKAMAYDPNRPGDYVLTGEEIQRLKNLANTSKQYYEDKQQAVNYHTLNQINSYNGSIDAQLPENMDPNIKAQAQKFAHISPNDISWATGSAPQNINLDESKKNRDALMQQYGSDPMKAQQIEQSYQNDVKLSGQ